MPVDNAELRKLIQENPDLPLVFYVSNDEICYDYGTTVFEGSSSRIGTVYIDDERTYDDLDDIIDEYRDYLCDDDNFKDLSDEEFDKAVKEYVLENTRHYKAIIIRVG